MKLIVSYILVLLCFACNEEFEPQINSFKWSLQLVVPEEAKVEIDSMRGLDITFFNKYKDYEITATTDTNGLVIIDAIEAGIYSISTTEKFQEDTVSTILNGFGEVIISTDQKDTLELTHTFVQERGGGFVIREYYYSGSSTPEGKRYLGDQYIEIYNNGQDTLYADSLLLVEAESYGNSPDYWKYMHKDSFVVKTIWALPSTTGQDFPIAPGKGFTMAKDPMNHRSDPNGNPNSPVDLGNADFDFWSDKIPGTDIDFAPPNLISKLWVFKGTDVAFHLQGGSAIAIVKINGNVDEYIANNLITKGTATSSSNFYCKINNNDVLDAVEATWRDKLYKRIPISLDAGSVAVDAGSGTGLCVRRKIERRIGKRVIYKDTNNSDYDFDHDVIPMPKVYE